MLNISQCQQILQMTIKLKHYHSISFKFYICNFSSINFFLGFGEKFVGQTRQVLSIQAVDSLNSQLGKMPGAGPYICLGCKPIDQPVSGLAVTVMPSSQ